MQPVQDLTIEDASANAEYQFTGRTRTDELAAWVAEIIARLRKIPEASRRGERQQDQGWRPTWTSTRHRWRASASPPASIERAIQRLRPEHVSTIFTQTAYAWCSKWTPEFQGGRRRWTISTGIQHRRAGAPQHGGEVSERFSRLIRPQEGQFLGATSPFNLEARRLAGRRGRPDRAAGARDRPAGEHPDPLQGAALAFVLDSPIHCADPRGLVTCTS